MSILCFLALIFPIRRNKGHIERLQNIDYAIQILTMRMQIASAKSKAILAHSRLTLKSPN